MINEDFFSLTHLIDDNLHKNVTYYFIYVRKILIRPIKQS